MISTTARKLDRELQEEHSFEVSWTRQAFNNSMKKRGQKTFCQKEFPSVQKDPIYMIPFFAMFDTGGAHGQWKPKVVFNYARCNHSGRCER